CFVTSAAHEDIDGGIAHRVGDLTMVTADRQSDVEIAGVNLRRRGNVHDRACAGGSMVGTARRSINAAGADIWRQAPGSGIRRRSESLVSVTFNQTAFRQYHASVRRTALRIITAILLTRLTI